jgi:hypothetical protein
VEEPAATETQEPDQASEEDSGSTGLIEEFKTKHGMDFGEKYKTDEELKVGLLHAASMVGRRDEDAVRWRQFSENPDAYLQQWGYSKAQQQAQADQAKEDPKKGTPEYDPIWQSQVERDPRTGAIIGVKAGVDPTVAGKLRSAEDFATQRQMQLIFQPEQVLHPLLEQETKRIREEIEKEVTGRMQAAREEQEVLNWVQREDTRKWLFTEGDPKKGFSQEGAQFFAFVKEAPQRMKIPEKDTQALIDYAHDQMELSYYRNQAKQATAPKQTKTTQTTAAATQPNVAAPPEDDEGESVDFRKGESLLQVLHRVTGVPARQN